MFSEMMEIAAPLLHEMYAGMYLVRHKLTRTAELNFQSCGN